MTVRVWSRTAWGTACDLTLDPDMGSVCCIAALPDGRLACGGGEKHIKIWNLTTRVCDMTLEGHTDEVRSLVVLAGGRLASASRDKSVRVWNVATGACEATLSGHTDKVWSLAALPDGRLVSGSEDLTIRVWSGKGWGVGCDATLTCSLHTGRLARRPAGGWRAVSAG